MSPAAIAANISLRSPFANAGGTTPTHGSNLSSGRSMSASWETSARSSIPWMRNTCRSATSSESTRRRSMRADMLWATSSRTTSPKRRRRSSTCTAWSRSSASSDTSKSASRVTRKGADSTTSMPGNSRGRKWAITSSSGNITLVAPHRDEPGHALGHLHPGQPLLAVLGIAHEHAQAERQAGDVGERLAGADRKRRQHRVDLALVVGGERAQLGPRGLLDPADLDAGLRQRRAASSRSYSVDCARHLARARGRRSRRASRAGCGRRASARRAPTPPGARGRPRAP